MRERENNCWRSSFLSWGFTAAIGAHSIFEEVAGFSPLWFPRGKFFLLSLVIIAMHVILSDKILRSYFLSLGFTAAIGAHSIFEEVVGFSPLWFPQGKSLCLLSLLIIATHVVLSDNILRSYCLNDKNIT